MSESILHLEKKFDLTMLDGEPVWAPRCARDNIGVYWLFRQHSTDEWYFTREDLWDACHPRVGWQAKLAIIVLIVFIILVFTYIIPFHD